MAQGKDEEYDYLFKGERALPAFGVREVRPFGEGGGVQNVVHDPASVRVTGGASSYYGGGVRGGGIAVAPIGAVYASPRTEHALSTHLAACHLYALRATCTGGREGARDLRSDG